MTDVIDQASDRELEDTEASVRQEMAKANGKPPEDWDGETCYDCGHDIEPPGRKDLGKWTCITCQTEREKFDRFRR